MVGVGIAWASILSMPLRHLVRRAARRAHGRVYGYLNFFIVIPEIVASLFFGRIIRGVFGENNPSAPLFVVMAGGAFMMIAAALVLRVRDVADLDVPENEVLAADAQEPLIPPMTAQPVPSTGLID